MINHQKLFQDGPDLIKKNMFTIFFRSTGLVLVIYFERGVNVDLKKYIQYCLDPAFKEIRRQRPNAGTQYFHILHDGTSSHTKHETINVIKA